jgi:hypothetical protein
MDKLSLREPASAWISRDNRRAHGHHKRDILLFPTSKFLPSCVVTSAFIPFLLSLLYLFVIRRRTWTRNRSSMPYTKKTDSSLPQRRNELCRPSSGYRDVFAGVKAARREGHDLPPYSEEVQNALSYICSPPSAVAPWCLTKHRNGFTILQQPYRWKVSIGQEPI